MLKSNPQDADAHYHRAQAHIVDEQLDKGLLSETNRFILKNLIVNVIYPLLSSSNRLSKGSRT